MELDIEEREQLLYQLMAEFDQVRDPGETVDRESDEVEDFANCNE